MKNHIITLFSALAAVLLSCTKAPEVPLPDSPMYEACYSCQEFIRNTFLKVVPSKKGGGLVSVWHTGFNRYVLKDVKPTWQKLPEDKGSIVMIESADGKFGFFDACIGVSFISPKHRRAWPYSQNICAVEDNGSVYFLNQVGTHVLSDFNIPYYGHPITDFTFRHGLCAIPGDDLLCGVINRLGEWVVPPVYKDAVVMDDCILVLEEGRRVQMDFNGKVVNPFVVDDVTALLYKGKDTGLRCFQVEDRYGLMGADGQPLTTALYTAITPVSMTLFQASLEGETSHVIINDKGRIIN